ncbi:MAG: TfuA-like protein [Kiloniellales bacterium]
MVFLGPSLPLAEARELLPATYLPPVAEGDVYRAALSQPQAIGIVDGYFEVIPAVWHKEILFAMSRGVHVFGASSMGALRAAELAAFGMEGVGVIFEAYRDGRLEDDDEVAVLHGPAELGYPTLAEAMVNIRHSLTAACDAGVIGSPTRDTLSTAAKELFYRERSYERILGLGREAGVPGDELGRLEAWLRRHAVDRKREDARQLLRVIRQRLENGFSPKSVAYNFEHTTLWERATVSAKSESARRDP